MASRYWVGGTATWDATVGTKWALTSGGAGGQTVPGASDDVFFDAASGAVTCTWSATSATVLSINCTGFTGTLATGGNSKTLAGTTTLWTSPVTCTITGAPTMTASSTAVGTRTVTCNHASPSAANSVNFTHTVGSSQTVVFSGTGFGALSLGFTGVIQGSPSVYGGIFVGPTGSSAANFNPTLLATGTLTTGVTRTIGNVTVNAPGATVTVNGATLGVANTFTLTAGTISLGGLLSAGIFSSSNTNTRAIAFSTNNIALTSTTAATTVLSMLTATGFTYTGTGGFTRNMAATATIVFGTTGGSTTNAPNLTVNAGVSALTITASSYLKNVIFTGSTCTVTASGLNMAGNLTLASGGTYTAVVPTFVASGTITSAGKTLGSTTVNGAGITVTLADAMTTGTTNTTTLTAGTLDLAGFTLSTGIFSSSNVNTRAITFGSGNIALTSTTAATTVLSIATAGNNFTWTGTGGFTRNQAATATVTFGTGGSGSVSNAPNLTVSAGSSALTITNNSWFKTVIFTGNASAVTCNNLNMAGNLTLASGGTYTALDPTFRVSTTFTSNGKTLGGFGVNGTGITVTLADALTLGITNTTTLAEGTLDLAGFTLSTGIFSSSNTNTRSITFGSGNIALTSTTAAATVLSMATATGFTWTGTGGFTRNMAATGTVSFGSTAGGTAANAPNLSVTTGASALTITASSYLKNVIFTGSTCTVTASGLNMAGNLTLATGGTYTAVVPTFLASATITSAGKTLGNSTINGTGITVTLADAMTLGSTNTLTLTQGTFTAANFNVTVGYFYSASSDTRTLNMGSGTWTISVSSGVAWNTASITGMTLNPSTSTITMTSASSKTFLGGGLTYYNLNQGGAGTLTISGSNTFNNITNTVQPNTVTFTAGTTQTVSNFSLSGTVGNLITINSATPGTQATLSKASGTVSVSYVSIQDSNATGGATWLAAVGNGNVDAGNNLGWIFITDVTVPVTNVLATGDVGSVLLGARTKAITNVLATGAVGTVNSERAKAIANVLATGAVGTVASGYAFPVTGVLATGDVGTMESGYAFPVTGVLATGAVGIVESGYAFPVTGVLATGAVGTVNSERDKAITNVLATGDVGAVGFGYAFPVTGVLATGAVGFMYPSWIPIPTGQTPVWVAVGTPQTPTWYNVTTGQTPVWVAVGTPQTPTWGDVDTDQTSTWTDIIQQ